MKKKKLQLIFPRNDLGIEQGIDPESLSPNDLSCLGLIYLASVIDKNRWEVKIYDEKYTPKQNILNALNGDVVGVSSWFNSHRNALSYLQAAKEKGAVTVIGGPNTFGLHKQILSNNHFIDFVLRGDTEESFLKLLAYSDGRGSPSQIESLTYRENNQIKNNPPSKGIPLASLPIIDLEDLVDKEVFLSHRSQKTEGIYRSNYMTTSAIRGCQKAVEKGRCRFCSIPTLGLRTMPVKQFYEQIRLLQRNYGQTNFVETGDDIVIPDYLNALLAEKPSDLELSLYAQASLERITPEIALKMKRLGIDLVQVGVESFDPKIMQEINKSRENLSEQIKFLTDQGIITRVSTIYGFSGESEDTINYTNKKVKELIENCPKEMITIRPRIIYPLPGSAIFQDCLRNEKLVGEYNERTGQDLRTEDRIDHLLLRELYIKHFTSLTVDAITKIIQKQQGRLPMEVRPFYL